MDSEPLMALLPDQAPDAVHELALLALHVRFEAPPLMTVLGVALKVTVALGAGVTVTVVD